jgi:hypothetical protein
VSRLLWTLFAAVVGCSQPTPPAPVADVPSATKDLQPPVASTSGSSTPEASVGAAEPGAEPKLLAQLKAHAKHHGTPGTRQIYTWTRKDQADAMRKHRWLLTRTMSPERGYAVFDDRLRQVPALGVVAQLLRRDALKYRRFGWVTPWPTLMGWSSMDYGDQLVRVTLKDEAIIGVLDSRERGWRFVSVDGAPVQEKVVLDHPERLGAVYHVWHGNREQPPLGGAESFREYVLCNESMIARWEMATDALRQEMQGGATMIAELAAHLHRVRRPTPPHLLEWNHHVDDAIWPKPPSDSDVVSLYEANLALPSAPYMPYVDKLKLLAKTVRELKLAGAPLTHEVTVKYGDKPPGATRPKPRPMRKRPCDPTMMPCR